MRGRSLGGGLILAVIGAAVVGAPAAARGVVTTWDYGSLAGWTFDGSKPGGYWEVVPGGGSSGGYARFYDTSSSYTADELHAPAAYLGDYTTLGPGARFEFDFRAEKVTDFYATIILSGPSGRFVHRTTIPTTAWTHYVLPLEPESWTMSMGTWAGLLANVTDLRIAGDVVTGHGQAELALDNFALVPEPAALALLAVTAAGLLRRRREVR